MEKEQRQAHRELKALLAMSQETRITKVRRALTSFRGSELARLLIAESEEQVHADPAEAYHLADLARLVLNYSPNVQGDFAPLSLALAAMANARRASGELREAEARFAHVRDVIRKWGVTAPEVNARVDELEGSLRKDQRLFEEAEELLTRAEILYRLAGEVIGAVRVALLLGTTYYAQGRPEEAIQIIRAALQRWPTGANPRLYVSARHNLACYLAEAGYSEEAAEVLDENEELYRSFPDPWTQLRVTWLRGDLLAARADEEAAELAYQEALQGFIERGIGYDAALVAMDLALLYLRQGRTSEVKRLAEEMIPIFQAQDVHREALGALRLFQEAARREEITMEQVRSLVKYLQESRKDPERRFEAP
jgi:tetratricopeptide (TPR) repeat protein